MTSIIHTITSLSQATNVTKQQAILSKEITIKRHNKEFKYNALFLLMKIDDCKANNLPVTLSATNIQSLSKEEIERTYQVVRNSITATYSVRVVDEKGKEKEKCNETKLLDKIFPSLLALENWLKDEVYGLRTFHGMKLWIFESRIPTTEYTYRLIYPDSKHEEKLIRIIDL